MVTRRIQLWVEARYKGEDNAISQLALFQKKEGGWHPFSVIETTPPFTMFVYSILACQHRQLASNAAGLRLVMSSASGGIVLRAGMDWDIRTIEVEFDVELAAVEAGKDTASRIAEKMKRCPLSRNLAGDFATRLYFNRW